MQYMQYMQYMQISPPCTGQNEIVVSIVVLIVVLIVLFRLFVSVIISMGSDWHTKKATNRNKEKQEATRSNKKRHQIEEPIAHSPHSSPKQHVSTDGLPTGTDFFFLGTHVGGEDGAA